MVTVTGKGQITLPVEIRRKLDIEPGDEVEVEVLEEDEDAARLIVRKRPSLKSLYGVLETEKPVPGKEERREHIGTSRGESMELDS